MGRVDKEKKAKIMDILEKAGDSGNYETSWNEKGGPKSKLKSEVKKGKQSKSKGNRFELKVRRDLEEKGRFVDKWNNNVGMWNNKGNEVTIKIIDKKARYLLTKTKKEIRFEDIIFDKCIIAKRKFNPFSKALTIGTGFPDFISTKHITERLYSVIGVEVKMNGTLSKIEKEKCAWYLQKKIFSEIWIAKQGAKRGEIVYDDFFEKYGEKYNKT